MTQNHQNQHQHVLFGGIIKAFIRSDFLPERKEKRNLFHFHILKNCVIDLSMARGTYRNCHKDLFSFYVGRSLMNWNIIIITHVFFIILSEVWGILIFVAQHDLYWLLTFYWIWSKIALELKLSQRLALGKTLIIVLSVYFRAYTSVPNTIFSCVQF